MPIDPRISLGVQQLQLNDPLTQYGQVQNILAAQSQRQAAGTQNELAQAQLGQARMSIKDTQEAQDFVTQVMAEAKRRGATTDDPMDAAMQMLRHPNPKVREAGKSLFDANQTVLAYQQQAQFMQDQSPEAAAGPTTTSLPSIAPDTAFTTPVSRGTQTNTLASTASPAPQVNAMAAPQGKTADSIKTEIQSGDRRYGTAPGWAKQRELLVKQFESALDPRRSTFAAITPKDYTQESIAKFNLTGNYADLVQKVDIKNTNLGNVNPADYTPDSVQKFATSGNYSDLVLKPSKADNVIANVNPADYTPESLAKFATSKNYADLVLKPAKADKSVSNINPDNYTSASVQKFITSNNYEDLVLRDAKETKLIANINPDSYTPESVAKFATSSNYADLVLKPSKADKAIANINPDSYTSESVAKFATSNNYADLVLKPSKADKAIGNVNPNDFTPKSVAKFNVSGDYADLVLNPKASSATPAAPVAVVGADGKIIYVSREEAISKNMTPAAALEGLSPKEIQKREASYPQATTSVKAIEKNTDNLIKDLKTLRDHPGLNSITGIAAGRLPGLTSDGRAAQALYDKIIAKGGFQVLQDMREASKTGGALGNVSDKEGAQLKSAFEAIDRKQDAADVRKALDAAISTAEGSKVRVRESYDMTYDYKNQGKAPAGAVDANNPLLKGK